MRRRRRVDNQGRPSHVSKVRVRFEECDPLGIVWHGNYIRYFEDGREGFGRAHGINYLTQKEHGFASPIVSSSCQHLLPLRYGEVMTVHTHYIDDPAAKMIFRYEIFDEEGRLACTGETVQVFVSDEGELSLVLPPFIQEWKKRMNMAQP